MGHGAWGVAPFGAVDRYGGRRYCAVCRVCCQVWFYFKTLKIGPRNIRKNTKKDEKLSAFRIISSILWASVFIILVEVLK